jgi:hypothetical protein
MGGGRAYRGLRGWVGLNGSAPEHLSTFHFITLFTTFFIIKNVFYTSFYNTEHSSVSNCPALAIVYNEVYVTIMLSP